MTDCNFQPLIAAYHDRELDAELTAKVQSHLVNCDFCRAELASLIDLSARIVLAAGVTRISQIESERMHQALTDAEAEVLNRGPLFRTMGLLGALAASVLIVCGVWLLDTRPSDAISRIPSNPAMALAPEWERVATTGYADPSPELVGDTFLSPRYAVDWMLDDLTATEH